MNQPITPAFAMFAVLLALCFGQYVVGLIVPRRYRRSNRRATLASCPRSSASTAANSPPTAHDATTASRNAPHESTPEPNPTPQHEASAQHTAPGPRRWWKQHRSAHCAASHPHPMIHSLRTTQCRDHKAAEEAPCAQHTAAATAGPAGSSPGSGQDE